LKTHSPDIRPFFTSQCWIETTALDQLRHAASLPGIRFAAGFPDLHPGKGIPIGAAFVSDTHVYPHLIGNDAGCGMALWRTDLSPAKLKLDRAFKKLRGLESTPDIDLGPWFARYGAEPAGAEPALGTIGGGNHFAELQAVQDAVLPEVLAAHGIDPARLLLLVHSGSRTLGEIILRRHTDVRGGTGLETGSDEAADYLHAHDNAVRWAQANRGLIAHRFLAGMGTAGEEIVNSPHNSVTCEWMAAANRDMWIHRKGAATTRDALVVIPGSRGTLSYLVRPAGDQEANAHSVAHGAGRKWMRSQCRDRLSRRFKPADLTRTKLNSRVICEDKDLMYEEAPEAYKDIATVVADLEHFGLVEVVATLRPLLTYKTRRLER